MRKYPLKFYFKLFALHVKQNGIIWTLVFSIRHFFVEFSRLTGRFLRTLEAKYDLPGSHSVAENNLKWNHYSWEKGENEWTSSEEWKTSVINDIMLANIDSDKVVLEIGPGYGRWTRKLIEISKRLIAVDVTEKCIDHCKTIFGESSNAEFHVNDGRSLSMVKDASIDYVWSFDVFVHIEPPDIDSYLKEFNRILRPNGKVIIHHGIAGKVDMSWRSSLTQEIFVTLLEENDFALIEQLDAWGEDNRFTVHASDAVSIFRKV